MEGLTVGRMVHYVELDDHYAAIVINVADAGEGLVDLYVFEPGADPFEVRAVYRPEPMNGTWHWIERA